MPITTLIFDCFGVVCLPVLNGWYKQHSERTGFVDENLPALYRKFDLGVISEDDVLKYFSEFEGASKDLQELREEIDSFLGLDAGVVETIKELRGKGYKTALLSNGNSGFFERKIYTTYPEFKGLFDTIIISSNVQMIKPGPEVYLHTLGEVGSKPEETIFIDDSQPNVDAAIKLGMQGHFYTDNQSLRAYFGEKGLF